MSFFSKIKINKPEQDQVEVKADHASEESKDLDSEKKLNWFEEEEVGELSVDVYEKNDNVIVKSTVAGVKPDDIEVVVDDDMVSIKGKRSQEEVISKDNYFYQECYWGSFARSFKLPVEVREEGAEAALKNGVLTIKLKKVKKPKSVKVPVN